jgi:hypothetical protein
LKSICMLNLDVEPLHIFISSSLLNRIRRLNRLVVLEVIKDNKKPSKQ